MSPAASSSEALKAAICANDAAAVAEVLQQHPDLKSQLDRALPDFDFGALPIISFGTSKLYHYAYPFLPPVALAGGLSFAWVWNHLQPIVVRWVAAREQAGLWPAKLHVDPGRHTLRTVFTVIAVFSAVLVVWTVAFGSFRLEAGGVMLFKNGSFLRP